MLGLAGIEGDAGRRRNPKVGIGCIEIDQEALGRGADGDVAKPFDVMVDVTVVSNMNFRKIFRTQFAPCERPREFGLDCGEGLYFGALSISSLISHDHD
jgi:hypothetical protein